MIKKADKHIAIVLYNLEIGGVVRVFISYAELLLELGYKVDLVVCRAEGILLSQIPIGVNLIDLGGIKLKKLTPHLRKYLKTTSATTLISGPEYTNFFSILANLSLPKQSRINLIVTQHSVMDHDDKDMKLLGRMIPWGKRLLYRFAQAVVAVSDVVALDLAKIGVPRQKIHTIYNPLNITKIRQDALVTSTLQLPDNYIVFVGRLSNVKNIELLIKAFDILSIDDLDLVIVGNGPNMNLLKEMSESTSKVGRIHFTGSTDNPYPIINGARVVSVPSFSEACPMVVVEALALGKTIAHTPNLGSVEILGDTYGYCSRGFEDPTDFADTLRRAIEEPINPAILQSRAENFDKSYIALKLEALI